MAGYLQDLHSVFPNGFVADSSAVKVSDANLLIDIFDDVKLDDPSTTATSFLDLVDEILYEIDPALASKSTPSNSTTNSNSGDSAPGYRNEPIASIISSKVKPSRTRSSQVPLHQNAFHLETQDSLFRETTRTESQKNKIVPIETPRKPVMVNILDSKSSVPHVSSDASTPSKQTNPDTLRVISIAGRSARDQERASLHTSAAPAHPSSPVARTSHTANVGNGASNIFNRTSIHPVSSRQNTTTVYSSDSDDLPSPPRGSGFRGRAAGFRGRGGDRRSAARPAEYSARSHTWDHEYPEVQSFERASHLFTGHSGVQQPVPATPDHAGFVNGWKPALPRARLPADGYRLDGKSTYPTYGETNLDESHEPEAEPFHWTGGTEAGIGSGRRIIGRGALGSRPGTFKSRSDERFAAASTTRREHVERTPEVSADDLMEQTDPWRASWEVQRRGIAGNFNKRNKALAPVR